MISTYWKIVFILLLHNLEASDMADIFSRNILLNLFVCRKALFQSKISEFSLYDSAKNSTKMSTLTQIVYDRVVAICI